MWKMHLFIFYKQNGILSKTKANTHLLKKKSILALKTLNVCFLTHYNRCTREVVAHGLKGLLTVHFVYNATKQSTGSE